MSCAGPESTIYHIIALYVVGSYVFPPHCYTSFTFKTIFLNRCLWSIIDISGESMQFLSFLMFFVIFDRRYVAS